MTTERILPAIALPVPARPKTVAAPRPVREAAAHATKRKETFLTTPARAGMLLGASAAIYAVSLAGVSALQSQSDAELAARQQPYLDALARTRAANDSLEAALAAVGTQAQALTSSYATAAGDVTAYEARLDQLAALVAEVKGSAAALPSRISLPTVTVRAGSTRAAPATTSTTGASGAVP